jgi:hypothetical protein
MLKCELVLQKNGYALEQALKNLLPHNERNDGKPDILAEPGP